MYVDTRPSHGGECVDTKVAARQSHKTWHHVLRVEEPAQALLLLLLLLVPLLLLLLLRLAALCESESGHRQRKARTSR